MGQDWDRRQKKGAELEREAQKKGTCKSFLTDSRGHPPFVHMLRPFYFLTEKGACHLMSYRWGGSCADPNSHTSGSGASILNSVLSHHMSLPYPADTRELGKPSSLGDCQRSHCGVRAWGPLLCIPEVCRETSPLIRSCPRPPHPALPPALPTSVTFN